MKKIFSFFIVIVLFNSINAQKYLTKTGTIHFNASVPLFEDIDAVSKNSVSVFNIDNGGFAAVVPMTTFKFKVALMEEHFNENYAESAKYPKATFSGVVQNFNKNDLSSSPKIYTISGTMNIHGVDNKMDTKVSIYSKGNQIFVSGKFVTKPGNYKIEIPKMVSKKIAENVDVDFNFILDKQK